MTELEKKHMEAIYTAKRSGYISGEIAAKQCAIITQRHGEIKRLEGMIEVYKEWHSKSFVDYPVKRKLQLEKQLKELKG